MPSAMTTNHPKFLTVVEVPKQPPNCSKKKKIYLGYYKNRFPSVYCIVFNITNYINKMQTMT